MNDIDATILGVVSIYQLGNSTTLTESVKALYFPDLTADINTVRVRGLIILFI